MSHYSEDASLGERVCVCACVCVCVCVSRRTTEAAAADTSLLTLNTTKDHRESSTSTGIWLSLLWSVINTNSKIISHYVTDLITDDEVILYIYVNTKTLKYSVQNQDEDHFKSRYVELT